MLVIHEYLANLGLTLAIVGLACLLLPYCRRDDPWLRALLMAGVILLSWRYIAWRFESTIPPLAFEIDSIVAWSFATLEALAMTSSTIAALILARTKDRHQEASQFQGWWGDGDPPRIDVYIATYNEDRDILVRTIAGAQATMYPNARIFVIDDGNRRWLRALCAEKGVGYITRSRNMHAKAGNINNALAQRLRAPDAPDFIAILDADFVPHRRFLDRAVSLFHDPKVALVQTPQHFFNPDPIQHNLGVTDVCPDEQRFFFNHVQPARDAWGIAICCGTSSLIRASALVEIGGVPTESVTEDFLLSLRFAEYGYETVYLNEALTEGLAAEGLPEYITQRARWCLGMMQIVRGPYNPFSTRHGLSLRHRLSILDSFLYWVTTFSFRLAAIVVPLLYWFFGILAVNADVADVLNYFGPAYAATLITLNWLSRGLIIPFVTDVAQLVVAWPIMRTVTAGLLLPGAHSFKVTDKGGDRGRRVVQWQLARPFLLLLAVTVIGLWLPLLTDYNPGQYAGDGIVVILFWTLYNLVVLILAAFVCVELPRPGHTLRPHVEAAAIVTTSEILPAWIMTIDPARSRIRATPGLREHQMVYLRVDGVGFVRAETGEFYEDGYGLRLFLTDEQHELLVRKLHTGEGAPAPVDGKLTRVLAGVGRRVLAPDLREARP
jgi:cellulose synthase (UDP-forming)